MTCTENIYSPDINSSECKFSEINHSLKKMACYNYIVLVNCHISVFCIYCVEHVDWKLKWACSQKILWAQATIDETDANGQFLDAPSICTTIKKQNNLSQLISFIPSHNPSIFTQANTQAIYWDGHVVKRGSWSRGDHAQWRDHLYSKVLLS